MEDVGFGAVQVFRLLIVHAASGEAYYVPETVMYLYNDAVLVEVISTTVEQAQFLQKFRLNWKLLHCVSVLRCIANLLHGAVVLSPSSVSVFLRLLRVEELLAVEVGDLLVCDP